MFFLLSPSAISHSTDIGMVIFQTLSDASKPLIASLAFGRAYGRWVDGLGLCSTSAILPLYIFTTYNKCIGCDHFEEE